MCDEALQNQCCNKEPLQPCGETLTLQHARLNLRDKHTTTGRINQVHCDLCKTSLCMLAKRDSERERERKRERAERGRKRGGGGGGGDRPGQKEEKEKTWRHVCCPACTGTGCQSGVLSPGQNRRRRKKHPSRPPERRRRRRRRGRERESEETPKPKHTTPHEKPRGVLRPKSRQITIPQQESLASEKRTNILPKSSPQNSVHLRPLEKENSKIAKAKQKENFLPRGFSEQKL